MTKKKSSVTELSCWNRSVHHINQKISFGVCIKADASRPQETDIHAKLLKKPASFCAAVFMLFLRGVA